MIIEYLILASDTFLTVLEHMYMMIGSAETHMYSVVPISHVYISYSIEVQCHTVFNGSGFFMWWDELNTVIYRVEKCEIDLPTRRYESCTGVYG